MTEYMKLLNGEYREWFVIHTDGSKNNLGVGSALVTDNNIKTASLPREASIFPDELYAIKHDNWPRRSKKRNL